MPNVQSVRVKDRKKRLTMKTKTVPIPNESC